MKIFALVPAVLVLGILLVSATASAAPGNVGFGFNASDISGFPTGSATLTGGGAYNPVSGFVHSAGGFRCTSDVGQGPPYGASRGRRRSLGHGRSPEKHELQVHRRGGGVPEDREHR
jgi:hypothetical protein